MSANLRRRGARTVIGLLLAALALYAVGSLGASIGSGKHGAVVEYQYPEITMDANPYTVGVGQTSTINWSTTNVDSCTAYGEWSGPKPLSGTEVVAPWGWNRSFFSLDCTGIWGETGDGVFVNVKLPLTPRSGVDQQQSGVSDVAQDGRIAQTFTVGTSGWLADVALNGTGTSSFDRVAITKLTQGGAPDTTRVLWSTTVANQATQGNLHLAKPLLVLAGQHLALTLTAPSAPGDDHVYQEISCGQPGQYARGEMYVSEEATGAWTQQPDCDTVFRTYVVRRFQQNP